MSDSNLHAIVFYERPAVLKVAVGLLIVGVIVLIAICIWLGVENAECKKRASDLTTEEVRKINVELQRYKDENKNLEDQLLKVKTDVKNLEADSHKAYVSIKQKDELIASLNSRLVELTRSVKVVEDYILRKAEIKGYDPRLDNVESILKSLGSAKQVDPTQMSNVDFLAYKVYKMLELNAQLNSQISELQIALNTCNTEKADLIKAATDLNSQVSALTTDRNQKIMEAEKWKVLYESLLKQYALMGETYGFSQTPQVSKTVEQSTAMVASKDIYAL